MKQDKAQQAARDEKLVPSSKRVKIAKTNKQIDPSMTQREETFQVALDILKKTPFYNAFLISSDVLEIYMQQFWAIIKKDNISSFYKFVIDNKTCQIDVEIFQEILDICPQVENQEFDIPPSSESLITLGAIINRCLSGKIISNDKLHMSRTEILWGMYNEKNVDYVALIREDLQYQIDHRQSKVVTWIIDEIKKTEAYQMYLKYSTGLIPPKKGRGRAIKEVKTTTTTQKLTKPRKKPSKKKQVLLDEASESEEELENMQISRKIRTPKVVFEIDTLKAQKASKHERRLQPYAGGLSEGIGSKPGVPDELAGKSAVSDEGAGIQSKVPDETKNLSEYDDDSDK
ncbi:hypothetical protein Tco_0316692 [Tanacetum coccineum]